MKAHIFVAVFAFFLLVPWLGSKEIHSRGEAREALVAQAMELSDNYILPVSYSDLVPSKPPMLHWLINLTAEITGKLGTFEVRAPVALASLLFCVYLSVFLQKRNEQHFWLPSLLLLTSVQWFRHSNTARVDMLLSVGVCLAIFELFKWREEKGSKGVPLFAILGLVVATYAKGPVGLVLPLGVFGISSIIEKQRLVRIMRDIAIVAIPSFILGSIWYYLAYRESGESFIDKVWYENAQRFAGTMLDEPHKKSFVYLYSSILWSMLPWSLLWIWPAYNWLRNKNRRIVLVETVRTAWSTSSFTRLLFIWILTFLFFYSIPEGKRDVYLLPIMPAFSILIARYLGSFPIRFSKILDQFFGAILALTVGVVFLFLLNNVFRLDQVLSLENQYLAKAITFYELNHFLLICFLGAVTVFVFFGKRIFHSTAFTESAVARYGVTLIFFQAVFFTAIGNALAYRTVAEQTASFVDSDKVLYSYNDAFYGISFYLKRKFFEIDAEKNTGIPHGKFYLFENNLSSLEKDLRPGQCVRQIAKATVPMIDAGRFIVLVEIVNCGT